MGVSLLAACRTVNRIKKRLRSPSRSNQDKTNLTQKLITGLWS